MERAGGLFGSADDQLRKMYEASCQRRKAFARGVLFGDLQRFRVPLPSIRKGDGRRYCTLQTKGRIFSPVSSERVPGPMPDRHPKARTVLSPCHSRPMTFFIFFAAVTADEDPSQLGFIHDRIISVQSMRRSGQWWGGIPSDAMTYPDTPRTGHRKFPVVPWSRIFPQFLIGDVLPNNVQSSWVP